MKLAIALFCLATSLFGQDDSHLKTITGEIRGEALMPGQSLHIYNNLQCVTFAVAAHYPIDIKAKGCHKLHAVVTTAVTCPKASDITITDIRPTSTIFAQPNVVQYQCKTRISHD